MNKNHNANLQQSNNEMKNYPSRENMDSKSEHKNRNYMSSKDRITKDNEPKKRASKDRITKDNEPKNRASKDRITKDNASKDKGPEDRTQKDNTQKDNTQKDNTQKGRAVKGKNVRIKPLKRNSKKEIYADEIIALLEDRERRLQKALRQAEIDEESYPEGYLRVSVSKGHVRYYQVLEPNDKTGKYLTKGHMEQVRLLAQKNYNEKFLKHSRAELELIKKVRKKLSKSNADLSYQNLSTSRKELIRPYIQTDEEYVEYWLGKKIRTNQFMEEEKKYVTHNGEKVRSKSEAIIADILCELGIPYRYEQALVLNNGITRYPDFTLLKVSTRKEYYLEHFGLLDLEEYRKTCIKKLGEYMENGIYLGWQLLITYETEEYPLDTTGIKKMLKKVFLEV